MMDVTEPNQLQKPTKKPPAGGLPRTRTKKVPDSQWGLVDSSCQSAKPCQHPLPKPSDNYKFLNFGGHQVR